MKIVNDVCAETMKDCSAIKADTGVKIYEKWKCKMGKSDGESFGKKVKKLFVLVLPQNQILG